MWMTSYVLLDIRAAWLFKGAIRCPLSLFCSVVVNFPTLTSLNVSAALSHLSWSQFPIIFSLYFMYISSLALPSRSLSGTFGLHTGMGLAWLSLQLISRNKKFLGPVSEESHRSRPSRPSPSLRRSRRNADQTVKLGSADQIWIKTL